MSKGAYGWLWAGAIVLLSVVYRPILGGEFVYDDLWLVARNPAIRSVSLRAFFRDPRSVAAPSSGLQNDIYRPLTTLSFAEDYHELALEPYGILKGVVDSRSFRKGSWGAEITDALKPEPVDIVIEGKRGLCGFATTNLDFILRSRDIRTVALAGFLTNCCVESTMRSAYERGYEVITLVDCTATVSEEAQQAALSHDFGMFSHPMSHVEFMQALA